jgi:hypothetical protein
LEVALTYSINDKVKFGDMSFDLQVEALGDKVVGEILSNGKILKRVEVEQTGSGKEDVERVFSHLKELLVSRIKERAVKKAVYLKDRLSKFFEVEEEQVKGFLMVVPTLEEPLRCMKGEMTPDLEEWLLALEEDFFNKYPFNPEVAFLNVKRKGEDVLVLFVQNKREGIKVVFAVSGVKLALVRRKLNAQNLRRIMASILRPN